MQACETALRSLKFLQQLLLGLAATIEKRNTLLEDKVIRPAKFRIGFDSLPNEILLKIITLRHPHSWTHFAKINKRCKDLVYSTPMLWTNISTYNVSPAYIERLLTMSRSRPLDVVFDTIDYMARNDNNTRTDSITRVIQAGPRWTSVTFGRSIFKYLHSESDFPVPDLSSLRKVELPGYGYARPGWGELGDVMLWRAVQGAPSFRWLTHTWNFKNVVDLTIGEDIPPEGVFQSVQSLTVRINYPRVFSVMQNPTNSDDCPSFVSFLNSLENLRALDIQIDTTISGLSRFEWLYWEKRAIKLHGLRSFAISFKMGWHNNDDMSNCEEGFPWFMKAFDIPHVKVVRIRYHEKQEATIFWSSVTDQLLLFWRPLVDVEEFHLVIDPFPRGSIEHEHYLGLLIASLPKKYPSLKRFFGHLPSTALQRNTYLKGPKSNAAPSLALLGLQSDVASCARMASTNGLFTDASFSVPSTPSGPMKGKEVAKDGVPPSSWLDMAGIQEQVPGVALHFCSL